MPGKLEIILRSRAAGVPVISCLGVGNKLDPSAFRAADIYETKVCPLARVMRRLCRENGIDALRVVYSEEPPAATGSAPASISFVPAAAGLLLAAETVKTLLAK